MWRHRLRTLLTVSGIAVALISFGLLRTVVDSWYAGAELGGSGRLITRNAASLAFSLPVSHAERLRRVNGVKTVTWANWFGGVYIDEKKFFAQFAVDPNTYFTVHPELVVDESDQMMQELNQLASEVHQVNRLKPVEKLRRLARPLTGGEDRHQGAHAGKWSKATLGRGDYGVVRLVELALNTIHMQMVDPGQPPDLLIHLE